MPPLPEDNVASYPQKDVRYFRSKTEPNCIRNDKVALDSICFVARTMADTPLPCMRTIYQDKVLVERDQRMVRRRSEASRNTMVNLSVFTYLCLVSSIAMSESNVILG